MQLKGGPENVIFSVCFGLVYKIGRQILNHMGYMMNA